MGLFNRFHDPPMVVKNSRRNDDHCRIDHKGNIHGYRNIPFLHAEMLFPLLDSMSAIPALYQLRMEKKYMRHDGWD